MMVDNKLFKYSMHSTIRVPPKKKTEKKYKLENKTIMVTKQSFLWYFAVRVLNKR